MAATDDSDDGWARWIQLQIDERAGGSQAKLGQLVGVPRDRVNRWVKGQHPEPDAVRAVCIRLGVPVLQGMVIAGILRPADVDDATVIHLRDPAALTKRELLGELDRRLPDDLPEDGASGKRPTATPRHLVPVVRPEGRRGTDWAARPREE